MAEQIAVAMTNDEQFKQVKHLVEVIERYALKIHDLHVVVAEGLEENRRLCKELDKFTPDCHVGNQVGDTNDAR